MATWTHGPLEDAAIAAGDGNIGATGQSDAGQFEPCRQSTTSVYPEI